VYLAAGKRGLSLQPPAAGIRIPAGIDEGRKTGGRFSHSGGAQTLLRCTDARPANADALDSGQQEEAAIAVSRRLPHGCEDPEIRCGAIRTESSPAAAGRSSRPRTRFAGSLAAFWAATGTFEGLLPRRSVGEVFPSSATRTAAIKRFRN